mmetsp:Transcript_39890/g.114313  ORF Transcript_39890/g.114313 Transcript_39890/m.114313 type:complete len:203 (+) Transcript_39890:126-734(+)
MPMEIVMRPRPNLSSWRTGMTCMKRRADSPGSFCPKTTRSACLPRRLSCRRTPGRNHARRSAHSAGERRRTWQRSSRASWALAGRDRSRSRCRPHCRPCFASVTSTGCIAPRKRMASLAIYHRTRQLPPRRARALETLATAAAIGTTLRLLPRACRARRRERRCPRSGPRPATRRRREEMYESTPSCTAQHERAPPCTAAPG